MSPTDEVFYQQWLKRQSELAMELTYLLRYSRQDVQNCSRFYVFSERFIAKCFRKIFMARIEGQDMRLVCMEVMAKFISWGLHPDFAKLAMNKQSS